MRTLFFVLLLLTGTAGIRAADYPTIPLERLLSKQQQDDLQIGSMTSRQREALRRTIIDVYRAGLGKGIEASSRTSAAQGVIESQIDGDFEGWDGDTVVKLTNGQIWQQSEYHYEYHYAFMPEVLIYPSGGGYKMKVDGADEAVAVRRLK